MSGPTVCIAATWFTFGHRFEPRYTLGAAKTIDEILGSCDATFSGNINGLLEKSRTKTYIYDICVRCGLIVKQES